MMLVIELKFSHTTPTSIPVRIQTCMKTLDIMGKRFVVAQSLHRLFEIVLAIDVLNMKRPNKQITLNTESSENQQIECNTPQTSCPTPATSSHQSNEPGLTLVTSETPINKDFWHEFQPTNLFPNSQSLPDSMKDDFNISTSPLDLDIGDINSLIPDSMEIDDWARFVDNIQLNNVQD